MKNTRMSGFRAAILVGMAAAAASAQVTANQKIGVVDMQAALTTTKEGQKAAADLRAKYAPKQSEFQQRQSEIQQKQEQYRRTENTISEDAKAKLARDIDVLQKNLQRDTQDAEQDMNQDQQHIVQDLSGKMMKVLTQYAQEHQFQLVFDVAGSPNNIYFASNTIDITRDLIAQFDKENPGTPSTSGTSAPVTPTGAAALGGPRTAPTATANAGPK